MTSSFKMAHKSDITGALFFTIVTIVWQFCYSPIIYHQQGITDCITDITHNFVFNIQMLTLSLLSFKISYK